MKLGEKIKLVRKHRGLTQRELGERLHLDGNAANRIAQYESGFRTPKGSRTKEIAKALNVREENFLTRAETPEDIIRTLIWYDWEHGCGGSVPIDTILLFDDFEEVGCFLKEWYVVKESDHFVEVYHGLQDIPKEHKVFSFPKLSIREQIAAYQEIIDGSSLEGYRQMQKKGRGDR